MKNNKVIIYDDACPPCAAYTKAFVATGMIEKENRKSFATIEPALLKMLDTKKCPDEIPLIDLQTKRVVYGIDALALVLEKKFPFIKKLTENKLSRPLLIKLYKLISYNRRVIVAAKPTPGNFDCTPGFNYRYRLAFLLIFFVFNSLMLFPVHRYVLTKSFSDVSVPQLQIAHLILVCFNLALACCLKIKSALEYLGQINMLALTTILATIPIILLNRYSLIENNFINNIYLLMLIPFVFKEYKRRMDFAGITARFSYIYVINILMIISFIFYLIYQ